MGKGSRNRTGLPSWLPGLSPRRAASAGFVAFVLALAPSGTAWAAVMPAGSRAWMVYRYQNPDGTATNVTSNTPGPNPPNGIPTTTFVNSNGTHGTGWAEMFPDRMRSFLSGYGPGFMYMSMFDTYTVHGVAAGPFDITVRLDVDAVGRSVLSKTANGVSVWGLMGPSITLEIGTFNSTTEELHEQWRVTAFDPSTEKVVSATSAASYTGPFERNLAGQVSYTRSVSVGEVFNIAYGMTSATSWGEIDLLHTGVISVDLPEGVFLTSALAESVPEPTMLSLLAPLALALCRRGRGRGTSLRH